jgi:hypothetical protein
MKAASTYTQFDRSEPPRVLAKVRPYTNPVEGIAQHYALVIQVKHGLGQPIRRL